jgi:hypothetical protein
MPPGPSDPANMPMAMNKTSEGTPNRIENLIVKTLRMTRAERMMKIHSRDIGIVSLAFEVVQS